MRLILCGCALSIVTLCGCGWKMAETRIRMEGRVLEHRTNEPVDNVFIDVADERDKLDFTIKTGIVTDGEGRFDTTYSYQYEKWMWLGFPVFWLPTRPEYLYLEAHKHGYRRRITDIDCRGFTVCGETCPPNHLDPIIIRSDSLGRKR